MIKGIASEFLMSKPVIKAATEMISAIQAGSGDCARTIAAYRKKGAIKPQNSIEKCR
ncbi:hypothetical protein GCM10008957_54590 [Deinococcus ruber]|uniref:Uncharacterized protein n=1 Tax=Deinococcus ruber TaxID=1848197 RepID=A0A918KX39_9DEIO|nr:hypothetical protein GCM10008957_54590 [Deinococcus ruber]